MDYYYAMTNYHVLCCLLHRMVKNKKHKAKLWVSSYLVDDNPNLMEDLKKSLIFDEVSRFEEVQFIYYGENDISRKMMTEEMKNICEKMKKYSSEIEKSADLYVCQDAYGLGIYLNKVGISYNYFEDGCGRLSCPDMEMGLIMKDCPIRGMMVQEYGCLGESSNVRKRFGDLSKQKEGYHNDKDVDFSVKQLLKKLDKNDLARILRIYHCHKYDLGGQEKDLLLTWHYNNMGFMTLEEQREFFATLVDYFKDEAAALFIKPHPSDKQPNYEDWFRDAVVFERCMPSELLPFCVDGKFDRGITNWSTSVFGLKEILEDIVNFDKDIDETWRDFHKYFAISQYLNSNKKIFRQRIKTDNINQKQLLQLMKRYIKKYGRFYKISEKGNIYIIGRYDEKYRGKKCIALTGEENSELKNVLKIRYKGKTDFVYLYNLDSNDIHVEKEMHYLGGRVIIDISSFNEDVKQQIMKR